jgi:cytochrome c-type biogenesis protein CcmH/NrfF
MTRAPLMLAAALVAVLAAPLGAQTSQPARTSQPPPGPDPATVVGAPHGAPLVGAALEARAAEVSALLRCPVCQGLSVKDSPATMAQMMKAQVKDLLAAGYDQDQVLAYFERSYGEFVRLQPPLRGVNWLVWMGPGLGLLVGAGLVAFVLRQQRRAAGAADPSPSAAELPGPQTLPEDPRLARYVLRVRELAYGWPGGSPPVKGAAAGQAAPAAPAAPPAATPGERERHA